MQGTKPRIPKSERTPSRVNVKNTKPEVIALGFVCPVTHQLCDFVPNFSKTSENYMD